MRKILVLSLLILSVISFNSFGKEITADPPPAASALAPIASEPVTLSASNSGAAKWVLIGIDTVLTGISAYMVFDERKAADDYVSLYNSIDNTSPDNYQLLKNKKSDGENKAMAAGVVSGITVFFLAYTAADALWFHLAFIPDVKTVLIPDRQGIKITWSREF